MSENNRVLVGVDGSDDSLAAVDLAADQAARRGVPLRISHSYLPPIVYAPFAPPYPQASFGEPSAEAGALVAAAVARARRNHPDLSVHGQVVVGGAAGSLIEDSRHADLVVVGTRGGGGFLGLLVGSVAVQVAEHAACPVLIARPAGSPARPEADNRIVLGIDGSPAGERAVEFAFDEAYRTGAALVAVHVWQHLPVSELTAEPVSYSYPQAKQDATRLVAEVLAGWREKYPDVEVRPAALLAADPAAELVRASATAGMVVVGSRGRGELLGTLLGSVGQALIRHAACPVAVVR